MHLTKCENCQQNFLLMTNQAFSLAITSHQQSWKNIGLVTILSEKYYEYLNVFSQKDADIFYFMAIKTIIEIDRFQKFQLNI